MSSSPRILPAPKQPTLTLHESTAPESRKRTRDTTVEDDAPRKASNSAPGHGADEPDPHVANSQHQSPSEPRSEHSRSAGDTRTRMTQFNAFQIASAPAPDNNQVIADMIVRNTEAIGAKIAKSKPRCNSTLFTDEIVLRGVSDGTFPPKNPTNEQMQAFHATCCAVIRENVATWKIFFPGTTSGDTEDDFIILKPVVIRDLGRRVARSVHEAFHAIIANIYNPCAETFTTLRDLPDTASALVLNRHVVDYCVRSLDISPEEAWPSIRKAAERSTGRKEAPGPLATEAAEEEEATEATDEATCTISATTTPAKSTPAVEKGQVVEAIDATAETRITPAQLLQREQQLEIEERSIRRDEEQYILIAKRYMELQKVASEREAALAKAVHTFKEREKALVEKHERIEEENQKVMQWLIMGGTYLLNVGDLPMGSIFGK